MLRPNTEFTSTESERSRVGEPRVDEVVEENKVRVVFASQMSEIELFKRKHMVPQLRALPVI